MSGVSREYKNSCRRSNYFLVCCCAQRCRRRDLPKIRPAPEFTLTKQDGNRLALKELRGKVLAITFIFASCTDTCPLLTAKMAGMQDRLGPDFGSKVYFLSITVDPERDTPEVLKRYAEGYKANLSRLGVSHRHTG